MAGPRRESAHFLVSALESGVALFNEHRYWDAHEAWEGAWKRIPSPARERLQGLIQACGVFHLLEIDRVEPALRLARRALELLATAVPEDSPLPPGFPRVPGIEAILDAILKDALDQPPAIVLARARRLRAT